MDKRCKMGRVRSKDSSGEVITEMRGETGLDRSHYIRRWMGRWKIIGYVGE